MSIKLYEQSDDCFVKIEKKDIYNNVKHFLKYYINVYKQLNQINRKLQGDVILENINNLYDMTVKLYFKYSDNLYDDMYLCLKTIEFHLRIMYDTNMFNKHVYNVLATQCGNLSLQIKGAKEHELCK